VLRSGFKATKRSQVIGGGACEAMANCV
jgi:hypothetical protein